MLLKQGETYNDASDIYALLREGKLDIDEETRAQAQKDIAVDGYWGIEQTSERLVSFAMALTGGDRSKVDEMIEAVKKGYDAATEAWGGELPEISKQTLDTAISKLEAWRDGKDHDMSEEKLESESYGQSGLVTNTCLPYSGCLRK
jgi:molecular chaperone DnaK (HSP70)